MGKATILVVPVTIVVVGLIIWGIIWMLNRPTKQERVNANLLGEAFLIFQNMRMTSNVDDMDILTKESAERITKWSEKYRKVRG